MLTPLGVGHQRSGSLLLKTGQTTQYSSELDDGFYEMGVAKSYTINTTGAQTGTTNVDLTHLISDTGAFTAGDQTYTDVGKCGVFKAAGGEVIIITGSGSNDGTYTSVSADADTLVVTVGFVNEPNAPETTFKKREAISNNTVFDLRTRLTWMRYISAKMGILGNGRMPWTGQVYDIFQYCAVANAASLGGQTDWRIPNILEYISIMDFEAPTAFPDAVAFPAWAANNFSSTTRVDTITDALYPRYNIGLLANVVKTGISYCGLVRGG